MMKLHFAYNKKFVHQTDFNNQLYSKPVTKLGYIPFCKINQKYCSYSLQCRNLYIERQRGPCMDCSRDQLLFGQKLWEQQLLVRVMFDLQKYRSYSLYCRNQYIERQRGPCMDCSRDQLLLEQRSLDLGLSFPLLFDLLLYIENISTGF